MTLICIRCSYSCEHSNYRIPRSGRNSMSSTKSANIVAATMHEGDVCARVVAVTYKKAFKPTVLVFEI